MSLPLEKKKRKKKGKYKKNSQYEHQLKKDDLEFLTLKTKYSSDEIIEWHRSSFVDQMWFMFVDYIFCIFTQIGEWVCRGQYSGPHP